MSNIVDLIKVEIKGEGVIIPAEKKEVIKEPEKDCDDVCGCELSS